MSIKPSIALLAALVAALAISRPAHAKDEKTMNRAEQTAGAKPVKKGHLEVNGVNYYYEIRGKGEPVLLLHGGLGQIEMFGPVLAALSKGRQVIGVDLQGHGRTSLGEREIRPVDMGDDMAVLVKKLGYEKVDVLGYSLGGGVGFRLAVQHPQMVRRMVLVSVGYAQDGFYPEMLPLQAQVNAGKAEAMKDTPMYRSYVAVAPHPEEFPRLLDRMGEYMRKPYDWSADVSKLTMPVMLVFGDSDMIRPEHIVKFYQLLGGGLRDAGWMREHMSQNRLAILPNLTHYEVFQSPLLAAVALPFLNREGRARQWTSR
jgi:pimeloyl-ACP methyl ester carboxylesterase